MGKFFVTGIGTDVGKTIVSAILVETLQADYWKPIQAGDLENSDTLKVKNLITNTRSKFHQNSYALQTPMSPHAAAAIDDIHIDVEKIIAPKTNNHLVIEGAGGLLVPLNDKNTIADIIQKEYKIILVSRHYLGSINHTLLSAFYLKQQGFEVAGIVFSGNENKSTEEIIAKQTKLKTLGRIEEEQYFDQQTITKYANLWRSTFENLK